MPKNKATKKDAVPPAASVSVDAGQMARSLYEQQSMASTVGSLKERLQQLTSDNDMLRRTRTKMGRDTQDLASYFQDQVEERNARIQSLEEHLRKLEFDSSQQQKTLEARLASQRKELEEKATRDRREALRYLQEAQAELETLREFKKNKAKLEQNLDRLATQLESEQNRRVEEVRAVERRWMEDKAKMIDEQKARYDELKTQARAEAQRRLDDDLKRIVIENKRMAEELRFQRAQNVALSKEASASRTQSRALAREIELAADKEREYAARGSRRARQNQGLQRKVEALERSLGDLAREHEQRRKQDSERGAGQLDEARLEAEGLRGLLRARNRELRTVRRLAEVILGQRSEVEQFFLEALEEVKKEAAMRKGEAAAGRARQRWRARRAATGVDELLAGRRGAGAAATGSPMRGAGGKLGGGLAGAGAATMGGAARLEEDRVAEVARRRAGQAPVSLGDLTPEEKETVLRMLFARMNQGPSGGGAGGGASTVGGRSTSMSGMVGGRGSGMQGQGQGQRQGQGGGMIGAPFGLAADVPSGVLEPMQRGAGSGTGTAGEVDGEDGPGELTRALAARAGISLGGDGGTGSGRAGDPFVGGGRYSGPSSVGGGEDEAGWVPGAMPASELDLLGGTASIQGKTLPLAAPGGGSRQGQGQGYGPAFGRRRGQGGATGSEAAGDVALGGEASEYLLGSLGGGGGLS